MHITFVAIFLFFFRLYIFHLFKNAFLILTTKVSHINLRPLWMLLQSPERLGAACLCWQAGSFAAGSPHELPSLRKAAGGVLPCSPRLEMFLPCS